MVFYSKLFSDEGFSLQPSDCFQILREVEKTFPSSSAIKKFLLVEGGYTTSMLYARIEQAVLGLESS